MTCRKVSRVLCVLSQYIIWRLRPFRILYLGNVEEEEFTDGLGDILGTIPTEVEMCKVKIYRITSDKSIIKPSLRLFSKYFGAWTLCTLLSLRSVPPKTHGSKL